MKDYKEYLRIKVKLGCPLTKRERAYYLLLFATDKEVAEFIKGEKV